MTVEVSSGAGSWTQPLLERDNELAELDALLGSVASGEGRLLLIEGAAGVGKTRLLQEAGSRAEAAGAWTLCARGGELERDFGFGIVRQLLEPALARVEGRERDEVFSGAAELATPVFGATPSGSRAAGDPSHAVLHGLHWLVANLSELSPLLLMVDDVHWADSPSLRFLLYLGQRLPGLRAGLLLATRSDDGAADPELIRRLTLEARAPAIRPQPLGEAAVAKFVKSGLGEEAGPILCAACGEATGGNPFLLAELVGELRSRDTPAGEISPDRVRTLGPERIAAALLLRIGHLDPVATRLARAVAVLGAEADPDLTAELAGVDAATGGRLTRMLADANVLESGEALAFVHPIVRTAVYEELPVHERAEMHALAARLLAEHGAEPESIAVHLLATDRAGNPATVDALLGAAAAALASGAPETAAAYLRRALAEPPPDRSRPQVLHLLGLAEASGGDPSGIARLREAADSGPPGPPRAAVTASLVQFLLPQGFSAEAVDRLEAVASELPDSEEQLRLQLLATSTSGGRLSADTYPRSSALARELAGAANQESPAGRMLLGGLSFQRMFDGAPAGEATVLAERALAAGLLDDQGPTGTTLWDAVFTLIVAEEFAAAERYCKAALAAARATGNLAGVILATNFLSILAFRRGHLSDAESDARLAVDAATEAGYELGIAAVAASVLIEVLIENGEFDGAAAALEVTGLTAEVPDGILLNHLLHARGRLRASAGDSRGGLLDLRLVNERGGKVPHGHSPATAQHRFHADFCVTLAQQGESQEAAERADEQLRSAEVWGTPGAIGVTLRTRGLVEGGQGGIEMLRESAEMLEDSERNLEYGRALVDLGAALRRSGHTKDARTHLARGMDVAHSCRAAALIDRAQAELIAAGARPRRPALTGADALTPGERRVAEMAAGGMANKEIAQALFVTLRTVEMHLSNTYKKLDIGSRRELPRALESGSTPE